MDRAPGQAASTATEALDVAFELNKLLDCGLDRETLSVCIALIESGVNPEALAEVVKRLRAQADQAAAGQQQQQGGRLQGQR